MQKYRSKSRKRQFTSREPLDGQVANKINATKKPIDAMNRLIHAFNQSQVNKEWMIPLNQAFEPKIQCNIIGKTLIISGPAQSGKTSLVYWALRHDYGQTAIVVVDCAIYRTEMQFIQKLARQVGEQIKVNGLDRRAIAQENIKFSQLDAAIKQQQRPVVILIRNAERLVEYRKQILLYNLLEWIATGIKKWVGLVFTTRLISFTDRFEKRVRSRLSGTFVNMVRPTPQILLELLCRRVEWLCVLERQYEGGCPKRQALYEKILRCMKNNKKMIEVVKKNQEYAQKDIVFFLNSIKMLFSFYRSGDQIMKTEDKCLKVDLAVKLQECFVYIFPFIPKNLLQTCTFPEYLVMSIIYFMGKHTRTPYRFKTVYEVYQQFKQTWVTSEGMGSAFIYSKNILERSVLKLEELNLIQLDNKEESIWNCDIRCAINPEQIFNAFKQIRELPSFFKEILKS